MIQDYLPSDPALLIRRGHNNLVFWTSLAVMAQANGVPVSTWFVGIGPLATDAGRQQATLLLSLMRTVSVRDEASAKLARDLGVEPDRVTVGADPVFGWVGPERLERDQPVIAVALRRWEGIDAWLTPVAEALDLLAIERSAHIQIVPFQSGRGGIEADETLGLRLASRMRRHASRTVLPIESDTDARLNAIGGADAVLAMRLHSIISAAAAGVPMVAISYDPKVDRTMEMLGRSQFKTDIGSPDRSWLVEKLEACLEEGGAELGATVEPFRETLGRVAHEILTSTAESPPLPANVVADVVAGLALTSSERGPIERELALTKPLLAETTRELESVRAQFQEILGSRAMRLAHIAWQGRKAADRGVKAVQDRFKPQQDVEGSLTLAEILEKPSGAGAIVVFAPGIHWDVELFQRPQQMALAFARRGYSVLYQVDEQYRGDLTGYRQVAEGIYEGYPTPDDYRTLTGIKSPLFLSYVYNFAWGSHLDNPVTVYEHIDHLEVFEHVHKKEDLAEWHARGLAEADIVVGSAGDLVTEISDERPDALLVPNGVAAGHFQKATPLPSDLGDLVETDTPVVGYYGALAEWFDYELVRGVAERMPDHAFVLIGPDYDGTMAASGLADVSNIHWLGTKPYSELPGYLQRFNVATIPFKISDVTHAVSPLKLFEYMAGGKPIVTTPLRECASYDDVILADGVEDWVEMIQTARELGADPIFRHKLKNTATANTWDVRVEDIITAAESARSKRDSGDPVES